MTIRIKHFLYFRIFSLQFLLDDSSVTFKSFLYSIVETCFDPTPPLYKYTNMSKENTETFEKNPQLVSESNKI